MKTAHALVMNPMQGVSEKEIFQDDCYFNGRNSVYEIEKAIDSELQHIREVSPFGRHYTRYCVATPEQNQLTPMGEVIHSPTVDEQTTEQNHSLPISVCGGSIEGTTTYEGNRNPYSSGIFLPQIYLSNGYAQKWADLSKAEFVEWLISGNKASNRTNNANLSYEVVETIPHPLQGGNYLLTKPYEKIKMTPIQHTARNATTAPIVFTSDVLEVVYA